jgi:antitoxin VapB
MSVTIQEIGMAVHRSRTFRSGNSKAIRLPKDIAFGDDVEVIIARSGEVLTIDRVPATVAEMIERLRALPALPGVERRDTDELPERPEWWGPWAGLVGRSYPRSLSPSRRLAPGLLADNGDKLRRKLRQHP